MSLSSSRAAGQRVHFVVQKSIIVGVPLNATVVVNSAVARLVKGYDGSVVTDDMLLA